MAKTTDWGLTDAGFRRPTYAELLDALEYKARELYGSRANLTVRSPLGVFLRIYAWMLNLLFSTLDDVCHNAVLTAAKLRRNFLQSERRVLFGFDRRFLRRCSA